MNNQKLDDTQFTKSELIRELQQLREALQFKNNPPEKIMSLPVAHFEVMERISLISLQATTLEEALEQLLDELLLVFSCDRAWFLYPCDPNAETWGVPMECTRPNWPGANAQGLDLPMTSEAAAVFDGALRSPDVLKFDPESGRPMPEAVARDFHVQSQIVMALYPKVGQAWLLGMHYCEEAHVFSQEEEQLFNKIGLRISDVLNSLIYFRDMIESEKKYRGLFEAMSQGVIYYDTNCRANKINPAAQQILGMTLEEIRVKTHDNQSPKVMREDGSFFEEACIPCTLALHTGVAVRNVVMGIFNPFEKKYRWIIVDAVPQFKEGFEKGKRRPAQIFTTFTDITERKKIAEEMQMSAAVFQNTAEAILVTDKNNRIVAVNKAFSEITGYSESEAMHQAPSLLKSNKHDKDFFIEMWSKLTQFGSWQGEIWNCRKNGEVFPTWSTISTVNNDAGGLINYVEVFSDISQLKRSQERVDFLSFHDPLTHLPNRLLFKDRLEGAIQRARREAHKIALLFLDLDRFKTINDSLGHPVGDLLLKKAAGRISEVIRVVDTVSRLGGDEFVVIINNVADAAGAEVLAKKIMAVFVPPFHILERDFHLTVSIGISLYPKDGEESATLVKNADTAMYQAKEEGRNTYRFYTPALTTAVLNRLTLETSLRQALTKKELILYYQPQYNLKTGQMSGVEALVRWQHPEFGLLPPAKFIPFAEESGLIVALGKWVLQTACREVANAQKKGHRLQSVAVNVSGIQLLEADFFETVQSVLETSGLSPNCLELEITESFFMKNTQWAIKVLEALRALGISIAIDDFGTGYSSLSYLRELPIDTLKIDRSFISDLPENKNGKAIVSTMLTLAHELHHKVIAEGVETTAQQNYLKTLGCTEGQGYLYSKPLPLSTILLNCCSNK